MDQKLLRLLIKEMVYESTTNLMKFTQDLSIYKAECRNLLEKTNEFLVMLQDFKSDQEDVMENVRHYIEMLEAIKTSLHHVCYPEGVAKAPNKIVVS